MSALATIGIGRTMEKKLGAVGITTVEELAEVGEQGGGAPPQGAGPLHLLGCPVPPGGRFAGGGDPGAGQRLQGPAEGIL